MELPFVTTRESASFLVLVLGEVHLVDRPIDKALSDHPLDTLDASKEVEILYNSHLLENRIVLRAVSDTLASETKPALDVPATNRDPTVRRHDVIGQTLKDSGLTGSIDTK